MDLRLKGFGASIPARLGIRRKRVSVDLLGWPKQLSLTFARTEEILLLE